MAARTMSTPRTWPPMRATSVRQWPATCSYSATATAVKLGNGMARLSTSTMLVNSVHHRPSSRAGTP